MQMIKQGSWNVETDNEMMEVIERELYEKTRKATEESRKQAEAQFKDALLPEKAVAPLDSWPAALQLLLPSALSDCIPLACELSASTLLLLQKKIIGDRESVPLHFTASICLAFCCITVLTSQLLIRKWYQGWRGFTLQHLATILCIWESIQLFVTESSEHVYIAYHCVALSTCMSVLYRLPYFIHIRWRIIGTAFQAAAITAKGAWQDALVFLVMVILSHSLGFLLGYMVETKQRPTLLKSKCCLKTETTVEVPMRSRFEEECENSFVAQYWNVVCAQDIGKESFQIGTLRNSGFDQRAPRRALGGFAGGFAGVSGLKCKKPLPSISLLSCCDSQSVSQEEDDDDVDSDEAVCSSSISFMGRSRYSCREDTSNEETSTASACSQTQAK